ncbi:Protein FAR1-RELATED SEQUENCE 5 [Acorus calamus]|uniref:Protein FAR1-RELATED SEQUENCE 5 n=1 Tax=Acorus calamus TaxID=4465 RepID=A0AAV9D7T6_ACOCL|nr:Protein FAR1-RELATED SEQUENCE 5 [Acorus calamus]
MENEISEVGLELDNSDPQDIEPNEEMMDKSIEGGDTLTSVDGDAIVEEPAKGMEFDNEEDARGFYFDYARRVGFTIRIDKVRRSMRDRAIIARQYVCSKEGFCVSRRLTHEYKRQRTVKREGCMARMMVKREKSGKWVVSSFIKEHNHELVVAARDECCLRSRKHKCCATRKSSKVGCGEGSCFPVI